MSNLYASLNCYLKAHVAALGAALSLVVADLNSHNGLTATDWYGIVGAALGVGAAVAVVPNSDGAPAKAVAPAVSSQDTGA